MVALIIKPARTAMQSGTAKAKDWLLVYESEQPKTVEPLMGWTGSADMKQQILLKFASKEEAIAYCRRHAIPFRVHENKLPARRVISYSDNFTTDRRNPWTH